ncbi:MAG: class I SAM-dependent methyltransferase [Syntrophomonadaceae bacterium]
MKGENRNFDKDAATWDENAGRVKMATNIANSIIDAVSLRSDMDLLDFGCGTGLLTLQLQPLVRSIKGFDSSKGMLKVLDDKIMDQNISNVTTTYIDIEQGGILKGSYDLVVCSMTLHHVREPQQLIKQFKNVLKPDGILCIADLDSDGGLFHGANSEGVFHNGFDRNMLRETLREAGFCNIQFRTATEVVRFIPGGLRPFTIFLATGLKHG